MKNFPNEKIMQERESFFSPGSTLDITSDHRKNQSRASLTATPNATLHRCVTLCHFEDLLFQQRWRDAKSNDAT